MTDFGSCHASRVQGGETKSFIYTNPPNQRPEALVFLLPSTPLVVSSLRVFLFGQLRSAVAQLWIDYKDLPMHTFLLGGYIKEGVAPIVSGDGAGRRLHRTLDEQALPCAALCRPGNLSPVVQQIEPLETGETLTRADFMCLNSQLGADVEFREGSLDPFVNAAITFDCREGVPGMGAGPDQAVGPVGIMRHDSTPGRTSNQRPQGRQRLDLAVFLKIPKRGGWFSPTIEAKHGLVQARHGLQQRLVQRHVERKRSGTALEITPLLGRTLFGRTSSTSPTSFNSASPALFAIH